ncbi:unnamed protein product [Sphenostylis stenocarpa]|uniref:non-specific serine/threonine protein kinase n=1 Tax=Sphenostylis stenocarpa TaxID=92480 RepID=A0AA86SRP2_9FABA|nr:unnamed protein product [Sphenostylis stenocarpa]
MFGSFDGDIKNFDGNWLWQTNPIRSSHLSLQTKKVLDFSPQNLGLFSFRSKIPTFQAKSTRGCILFLAKVSSTSSWFFSIFLRKELLIPSGGAAAFVLNSKMAGDIKEGRALAKEYSFILLILTLLLCSTEGLNTEGKILLELKNGLHDKSNVLENWKPTDETPCGWKGVNCTQDNDNNPVVASLNLSSMDLSGTLNAAGIGGLTHLTYLNLAYNELTGNIPKEIGEILNLEYLYMNNNQFEGTIPAELGKLSVLKGLNIYNNKLSGVIPDEIGNLSSLEELVAYSNFLVGPLPNSIGNLKNLVNFRAGANNITGNLPKEIGRCKRLMRLGLAQNQIGGEIPSEIGMLANLKELVLWGNQLSGPLPKEIGNCSSLENVAIYGNYLIGPLPKEIGNLKSLRWLYAYRNKLNGTIPREIGNLTSCLDIDFSENSLVGSIPSDFGKINGLSLLFLFENHLTGVIPNEFSNLKNLSKLDLSINNLTGPIPFGFQYFPKMNQLQLFDNSLSGIIPEGLGFHSPLWVVDFSDNNLTGRIPPHLCRNSHLMLLNLASNQLYGNIPTGILNCESLEQLFILGNRLTGSFPLELCKLMNMTAIDLSENRFSGTLPADIGNCRILQRLHIANNYFTLELPKEIGTLSQLVTFNVSSNLFTGSIPPEIFSCQRLQRLDLSQNNFSGSLPDEIGTLQHLEILKLSDNKLSGYIPASLGNLSHLNWLLMDGNYFFGEIPPHLGSLSSLQIAMDLSYNNLSGRIPVQLGNLNMLEYLYLNNNDLDGEIPSTFEELSSLLGCNFSYNNLSGPIPSTKIFQSMAVSSYIGGNNGLCGAPLGDCSTTSDSHSDNSGKSFDSTRAKIVMIIAASVGGVSLIFISVILYFLKRPRKLMDSFGGAEAPSPDSDIYFPPKEGFTFHDLVEATKRFHESYVIGKGACGTVYKAVMKSGKTIAVKKLASNREGNNIENSFRAEISTLGRIRHRNIVKLYGFCYQQGFNLLLYEYMERGSLGELLHGSVSSLEWSTRFMIALGAAEGLAYLHHDCKPKIIHRDIKSNNILLDENFEAHVGDFGLAKVIDMPQSKSMSAVAGSYGYIAPEYAYTMKVTEKCDIYSYGVVLLELLTGRTPVQPLEQGGDLVTWVRNHIREHNNSLTPEILDTRVDLEDQITVNHMLTVLKLALACTSVSPTKRPSMREVVRMLIESNEKEGNLTLTQTYHDLPTKDGL